MKSTKELTQTLYNQVLIGRPAHGYPVALYNRHLARLTYKLSKLDDDDHAESNFPDMPNYINDCLTFLNHAILHYCTKEERQVACEEFFRKVFRDSKVEAQVELERVARSEDSANLKSSVEVDLATFTTLNSKKKILQVICEIKREDGQDGGCMQSLNWFAHMVYGLRVCYMLKLVLMLTSTSP